MAKRLEANYVDVPGSTGACPQTDSSPAHQAVAERLVPPLKGT
jgi:hypothetical protein